MDENGANPTAVVEAPRGFYPGRVDDKGRLKLPVKFQEYLASLSDKRLFVTSLGDDIARIYPNSVWKQNEKFFESFTEDPDTAERISFFADAYGSDTEMDAQGRVLLSPELRRALNLENTAVQVKAYRGHIHVYSQAMYDQFLASSAGNLKSDLRALQRKGLVG
ncbi:MAG TPA: hypothetical protein DEH78_19725 [Solibacterales bacterium]|nr:hypothetical protein [Bryobacterales bacterium]